MNLVRSIISFFLLILLAITVAGWVWAGSQPPEKKNGARLVLAVSGVAAVGTMGLLWSAKQPQVS